MIYDHRVKHNGVYYEPGQEVPEKSPEPQDSEITFETDAVIYDTTLVRDTPKRGRPRKA